MDEQTFPDRIWLIHDAEADEPVTWADNPNPYAEYGEQPDDAVEYVRASVIAGKVAELEGRIEAVRKVVEEGYPGQPAKTDQCEHGRYGWEDCVACYDAAILAALAPYPERR